MSTNPSPNQLSTPTVSNSSVEVASVNLTRAGLFVFNPSATVTLYISPGETAATTAGCMAIQPQQGQMLGPPFIPPWTNSMNAIASSGGSNEIVILEFYP